MTTKIQTLEKKEKSFDQLSSLLREEIANLSDINISSKSKIAELEKNKESLIQETSDLKQTLEITKNKNEEQDDKIKELLQDIKRCEAEANLAINNAREEELEKTQQERKQKQKLEAIVGELEPQLRNLTLQLNEKDEQIKELEAAVTKLEKEKIDLTDINQGLEEEYNTSRNECKELYKRSERAKTAFAEKISKLWRLCIFKIEGFRNEVSSLRSRCISEFETNHEFVQETIFEIGKYVCEKDEMVRTKLQEERKKEISQLKEKHSESVEKINFENLQEKEQQKHNYERLLQKLTHENELLRKETSALREELQDSTLKVERFTQSMNDDQKRIALLSEEKQRLKQDNSRQQEESEALTKFLREELERIKVEYEQTAYETQRQIKLRYREEIETLVQMVDDLKYSNLARLKGLEGDMLSFEVAHEKDILELFERANQEKELIQKEVKQLEEELLQRDKEIFALRKDLQKAKEMRKVLQQESHEMSKNFEEKIEGFKEIIKSDNEAYLEKKNQTNVEIEQLRAQVKDLTKELKLKNQEIDGLDYRLKLQKADLLRYKVSTDERGLVERNQISQKINNNGQKTDELDSLLSRPIRTEAHDKHSLMYTKSTMRFSTEDYRPEKNGNYVTRNRFFGSENGN